jgi:ketosteroid isomerase-like protein
VRRATLALLAASAAGTAMHKSGWWMMAMLLGTGPASARDAAQDRRDLLQAEAVLCRAFQDGDAKTLRVWMDDGFTLTDSKGTVTDFAQNLDEVARRDPHYDVFRNHGQHVRLYGDAAIVTGITTIEGHAGTDAFAADFQYTDTWVYRDGRWKLAASHASRLPEGQGRTSPQGPVIEHPR